MNSTLPIPHKIKFEKSSLALKLEKEYGKAWIVEQYSLFDLYYSLQACIEQDIKIKPFTREIIKTGFYLQIDDPYTYLEIISDSNLVYEKGLIVLDAPTYFGHGFRNEIFLILYNKYILNPYYINLLNFCLSFLFCLYALTLFCSAIRFFFLKSSSAACK